MDSEKAKLIADFKATANQGPPRTVQEARARIANPLLSEGMRWHLSRVIDEFEQQLAMIPVLEKARPKQ